MRRSVRQRNLSIGTRKIGRFPTEARVLDGGVRQTHLFQSVPSNIPLDLINPPVNAIKHSEQKKFAKISARLRLDDEDDCPEDTLNRILWFAQKGNAPYPRWAITGAGR